MYSREFFAAKLGADGDPKLNAAADFAARLLNGPAGASVARIVLFGSVARGEARPDSDVDIMVFATIPRKALSTAAAEAAWEATVEWGESLEHILYTLDDLVQPHSYVVYRAATHGREIYAMDEARLRLQEAANLYFKADHHLEQSRSVSDQVGAFDLAVVGAYTAAELAAKALLLLKPDVELPSTHGGMIQIFGREYVKTGEAPAEWGQLLREKLETRRRALYDTLVTMAQGDVQPVIQLAQEMLDFLKRRLEEAGAFSQSAPEERTETWQ